MEMFSVQYSGWFYFWNTFCEMAKRHEYWTLTEHPLARNDQTLQKTAVQ